MEEAASLTLSLTFALSVYAATLSTVLTVGWLSKWAKEAMSTRNAAQIRCKISRIVPDPDGNNKLYFCVFITNSGGKTLIINRVWGKGISPQKHKEEFLFTFGELPATIAPGETLRCSSSDLSFFRNELKALYIVDARDKEWELPHKEMVRLKRHAKKLKLALA